MAAILMIYHKTEREEWRRAEKQMLGREKVEGKKITGMIGKSIRLGKEYYLGILSLTIATAEE